MRSTINTKCVLRTRKGMVYLLADWGMGDSESRNRNYVENSHELLRPQQSIEEQQREVDLHPLSNQVSFITRN